MGFERKAQQNTQNLGSRAFFSSRTKSRQRIARKSFNPSDVPPVVTALRIKTALAQQGKMVGAVGFEPTTSTSRT